MKGLVLSGGAGVRLRPITYSQQKQLIPIGNKPMLFYCIEDLVSCGVDPIGIVVGPNREQVMEAVNGVRWDARIEFIHQERPGGLAHAVKVAEPFLGGDRFVMYLGDNLLRGGSRSFVQGFAASGAAASLLLTTTDHPERYGNALVDEREKVITRLVEKPRQPESDLIVVGIYGLTPLIFEAIANITPSWRGELEITDALAWLLARGYRVEYGLVEGWWKDTGRAEDILEANALVLDDLEAENQGTVEESTVRGRVSIGKGTVVRKGSVVKGPAAIGEECLIESSIVGPYASIGPRCRIVGSEVHDSIVMEGTAIVNGGRVAGSLIGKNVTIRREEGPPQGMRLVLGDDSEVQV